MKIENENLLTGQSSEKDFRKTLCREDVKFKKLFNVKMRKITRKEIEISVYAKLLQMNKNGKKEE